MARESFQKPESPYIDTNATCQLLTLPAELRQRIYRYIFHGSTVIRSHIDPVRCKPPAWVGDYPARQKARWGCYQDWLDSNAVYKNILLTCKAIYHDALVSYLENSTLSISVYQLVEAPPRAQHLLHIRHIDIEEEVDRYLKKVNLRKAVSMLQRFSNLESVGLTEFEFTDRSKHREYFGPNNDGLKEAILADDRWGFFISEITRTLPKVELTFEIEGCATFEDLVNRIGDRNRPGPRTAKWLATSKLKLGSIRGDIESLAAKAGLELGPDETPMKTEQIAIPMI